MSITVGSNLASLKAQGQLYRSSEQLTTVFERLASGQRINKASDDAAGLAISSGLQVDQRVYTQGVRNLNDGLSALNIADSTIVQLSSIVIRIQELATQSANGTFSNRQRESLDAEAQALSDEFTRIAREAKFNDLNFFDGTLSSGLSLQGGYGTDGAIRSTLGGAIGTGDFSSYIAGGTGSPTPNDMATADLNGDGILDIVDVGERIIGVHLGNGDGTFQQARVTSGGGLNSVMRAVELADLNNDGQFDIVAAGIDTGEVTVLLGNGDGSFGGPMNFIASGGADELRIGDLNNDGRMDVVTANSDRGVSVLLGNGNGTLQEAVGYDPAGAIGSSSIELADFNGDGILDMASASGVGGINKGVYVQIGNGDGSFQGGVHIGGNFFAGDLVAGDFNGDGVMDLAASGEEAGPGALYLGSGDGTTFTWDDNFLFAGGRSAIEANDFNGDGLLDLVAVDYNNTRMAVFLGEGNGTFTAAHREEPSSTVGVITGDFNNDGVVDLLNLQDSDRYHFHAGVTQDGISAILGFSLKTQADGLQALEPLKRKLNSLSAQRGIIGAFQSRLATGISNLTVGSENFAAAESRIRDVDIALESANLTRLEILQQSAASVLAQANQQPQLAVRILSSII